MQETEVAFVLPYLSQQLCTATSAANRNYAASPSPEGNNFSLPLKINSKQFIINSILLSNPFYHIFSVRIYGKN